MLTRLRIDGTIGMESDEPVVVVVKEDPDGQVEVVSEPLAGGDSLDGGGSKFL